MGALDYTTNGVTMPAHSCKTASGGVWLMGGQDSRFKGFIDR